MRKIFNTCVALLALCCESLYSQTPAEILAYLKKNITVYYVPDPNTPDPDFRKVSYDVIRDREDNIFFGKTTNNGMNNCSQILISLFREDVRDQRVQAAVYYAMRMKDKPVDLFIMNDLNGINNEFLKDYNIYTVTDNKNRNYVWPGSYSVADAPESNRAVIIGEEKSVSLQHLKEVFCEMVACAQLGAYGPVRKIMVHSAYNNNSFSEMYFGFPYNDTRSIADHAISTAFVLYASQSLRNQVYAWTTNPNLMLYTGPKDPEIPDEYNFRNQILQENKSKTGFQVTNPPHEVPAAVAKNYRKYGEADFIDLKIGFKYLLRNDIKLGLLFYQYMERMGLEKFVAGLRFNSNKYFVSAPEKKLGLLFENLSLVILNGKKFEDFARARMDSKLGECFVIALYDLHGPNYLINQQGSLASDFVSEFENVIGAGISRGEAENIIPYYLATWQGKIQAKTKNIKFPAGKTLIEEQVDIIASVMGLPDRPKNLR
ncbi:MAG: hypothetical protein ACT4OJ_04620 [Bacteroidota bacterium]